MSYILGHSFPFERCKLAQWTDCGWLFYCCCCRLTAIVDVVRMCLKMTQTIFGTIYGPTASFTRIRFVWCRLSKVTQPICGSTCTHLQWCTTSCTSSRPPVFSRFHWSRTVRHHTKCTEPCNSPSCPVSWVTLCTTHSTPPVDSSPRWPSNWTLTRRCFSLGILMYVWMTETISN